ncbi:MAG: hypothetical protein KGZ96_07940 [Clostridia bacterium]|jgi:hypothetical protein|nr:hypothetical protein [Clostridia bacterium]
MRIREDNHHGHELYSKELQERVLAVCHYTAHIIEIKQLLAEINRDAFGLSRLFWSEEELREKQDTVSFFDARMQSTVFYTLLNMERYQHCGWKELIDEGENSDERVNFIPEKK